jgi:hypothetical protein
MMSGGGGANNMGTTGGGSMANMSAVNQSIPSGSGVPRAGYDQNGEAIN